ncbi:solute carrier organic anion transporter family member 1C1-like [Lampetra fluviatilis]
MVGGWWGGGVGCGVGGRWGGWGGEVGYILILRGVNDEDKSFAVGIQFLLLRLLAWLPAPALFGLLIDSSCLVWTESCHAERGACRYYDSDAFRTRYWSLQLVLKLVALTLFSVVLVRVRRRCHRRRQRLCAGDAANVTVTAVAGSLPMGLQLAKAEGAQPLMAVEDDGGGGGDGGGDGGGGGGDGGGGDGGGGGGGGGDLSGRKE